MKEIIEFLKNVENRAFEVYSSAADFFINDTKLSEFVFQLAEDEALHYHLMGSALSTIENVDEEIRAHITIDDETKDRIVKPLNDCFSLQNDGALTREILLKNLVEAEYSEWNDIFLYVIGSLKEHNHIFSFAASKIQAHHNRMERFLEAQKDTAYLLEKIQNTPKVWDRRILIVDDEEPLLNLLQAVLSDDYVVEVALDGLEAIKKVEKSYYDAIISDIDMPIMDGIEFYKDILKIRPQQAYAFAFATGYATDLRVEFAKKNGIRIYEKPYTFDDIRDFVKQCIEK